MLLIDVSGSVQSGLSARSDLSRLDAAAGLAMMARELCESCEVFTFTALRQLTTRLGFALRDAIGSPHGGTRLGAAVRYFQDRPHDRLIVLTDEESQDPVGAPRRGVQGYMINVASTEREFRRLDPPDWFQRAGPLLDSGPGNCRHQIGRAHV